MNNIPRDRIIAKIKKLLALARDGRGDPTEAETAMRQALAMMAKYEIDEQDTVLNDLTNNASETITKAWRKAGASSSKSKVAAVFPAWAGVLSWGVGKLFACRTYIGRAFEDGVDQGLVVFFGGYVTDVELAAWTFDYLLDLVKRSCNRFEEAFKSRDDREMAALGISLPVPYWAMGQLSTKARKDQFRTVLAARLQQRMLWMRATRAQPAPDNTAGSRALVVIDDAKKRALDKVFGQEMAGKGAGKKLQSASSAIYAAAQQVGDKARIEVNPLQHDRNPLKGGVSYEAR